MTQPDPTYAFPEDITPGASGTPHHDGAHQEMGRRLNRVLVGSGTPDDALGTNEMFFFNEAGAADTAIWKKVAGHWVVISGASGTAGPPGAVMRGPYNSGTTYAKRDAVTYTGRWWGSLVDGNIGHTPTEGSFWTMLVDKGDQGIQGNPGNPGPGLVPRGLYNAGTTYAQLDLVSDTAGNSWISLQNGNTGHTPAEGAYWTKNASVGAAGLATAWRSSAIGDGSTLLFSLTHSIGRTPSSWSVLDVSVSPKKFIIPADFQIDPSDELNKIKVLFSYPPATGQYIVGVVG